MKNLLAFLLLCGGITLGACTADDKLEKPAGEVKATTVTIDTFSRIRVVEYEGWRYTVFCYEHGACALRAEKMETTK